MSKQLKHEPYVMIEPYAKLSGYTLEQLAVKLGTTKRTLYNKINGTSEFSVTEAKSLSRILSREHDDIFLTKSVANPPQ